MGNRSPKSPTHSSRRLPTATRSCPPPVSTIARIRLHPNARRSAPASRLLHRSTLDGPMGSRYIAGTVTDGAMNVTLDDARPQILLSCRCSRSPLAHVFHEARRLRRRLQTSRRATRTELPTSPAPLTSSAATPISSAARDQYRGEQRRGTLTHPLQTLRCARMCHRAVAFSPATRYPILPTRPPFRPGDSAIHIITEGRY